MADPMDTAKIVTVAPGVFVRESVDTMGWIDMGEYGIAVDALEQRELEGEVFAVLAETLGEKPIRFVLNTHTHYDHVALNSAFERRFGARIVNQATGAIDPEGRWFEGNRRVLIKPMPDCHTPEDCIVWVPDGKVLFVGDIFGWGLIPLTSALTDTTAELLVETYARLIDYGADVVVPGHGPVCTTAELERWVRYFQWLREAAARGRSEGKSDHQMIKALSPPEDMKHWWRFRQWKHEDSVSKTLKR